MGRDVNGWLEAIADCSVLRVRFDDDALIAAIDIGLVSATPVEGDEDAFDCRLSNAGKIARAQALPRQAAA